MNVPFWTEEHVRATLPERDAESHKGTYGTALLLAGSDDMPGAALLAGLGPCGAVSASLSSVHQKT